MASAGSIVAAENTDVFNFLSSIRSPADLVYPVLPKEYSVPVLLSGDVAEEMKYTLKNLDLEDPQYKEIYTQKTGFRLILANSFYSEDTRELLAGILNPVEMIDVVLGSIVRYRQKELLKKMLNEASAERRLIKTETGPKWLVVLTPSGDRFAYEYEDMGAYIHETWLTHLEVMVDTANMLAENLEVKKASRLFSADSTGKPAPSENVYKYEFAYDTIEGRFLPSKMTLSIDGIQALSIKSGYRMLKKHTVFDSRIICYRKDINGRAYLNIKYGEYSLAQASVKPDKENRNDKKAVKIKQAASLAIKAEDALRAGNIKAAVRILKNIIQECEGTPQAIEAKKLMEGLPQGF
jgi:hypothetical protein